jgi:molecular chaperone GrpE
VTEQVPGGQTDDAGPDAKSGSAREPIVIRDKRKIDGEGRPKGTPEAGAAPIGQPGTPVAGASDGPDQSSADQAAAADRPEPADQEKTAERAQADAPAKEETELEAMRSELDERLRDLQRISAEYANYRKRVDRDRGLVAEQAVGAVIGALLPVLDDIDRARDHSDLVGPFAAVAEQLSTALGKFGLQAFGEQGDRFDPTRHEAVAHRTSADVTEPTCVEVMRRGYLLGDRLLRAALVAVADPE